MAKKKAKSLTLEENEVKEQHLKSYCAQAAIAAEQKSKADELRIKAAEVLEAKLDADPETKDFTGTVLYLCEDGKMYKIRVQRPDKTDWMKKRLKDPNLKKLKALAKELDEKKSRIDELKDQLAEDHPKCINRDFIIAYLK